MISSTPMPILMAAIVMLITSSGMPKNPITPKSVQSGIKFETMAMVASLILLKTKQNITKSIATVSPNVSTCELSKF